MKWAPSGVLVRLDIVEEQTAAHFWENIHNTFLQARERGHGRKQWLQMQMHLRTRTTGLKRYVIS
eukprot:scaffold2440_cov108-Cylindrotheca_fusiformis.AAC.4